MKRKTLLTTILAALIALTGLMAMAGCSWGHDDHYDARDHHDDHYDQQDHRMDSLLDDHQMDRQQNGAGIH